VLIPEIFSGDGNCNYHESVSAVNNWSDSENVLWLSLRLSGKGKELYKVVEQSKMVNAAHIWGWSDSDSISRQSFPCLPT